MFIAQRMLFTDCRKTHTCSLLFFSFFSVTRALSRALKIVNITLPVATLPRRIITRRQTTTTPNPKPKQCKRTAARINTFNDASTQVSRIWCVCRRSSFGTMIMCNNPNCVIIWFHLRCVNMARAPKGDWFCHNCRLIR